MVLDILFAAALVYLADGFNSPFFLALFLAVITNAVRFGATASFLSAVLVSFLYLFIGGGFTPSNFNINPNTTIGTMFLFLVVALATGYMTRELERERRAAVERAAQADSLRELSQNLVSDTDIKDVFDVLVDHAVQMTTAEHGRVVVSSQEGFSIVAAANRDGKETVPESEALDEHQLHQAAGTGEAVFASDRKQLVVPIASGDGATVLVLLVQAKGPFSNQDLFAVDALTGSAPGAAYRIVDAVHAAAVTTFPGHHLTFSIGVASYPEDGFTAIELVAAADQALYLAKREGKDRPCTFPQLVTELELADGNLVSMLAEAGPQVIVAAAHAVDPPHPLTPR